MEIHYGGRAGCYVRRIPVPGVYVDFTSQYPTVFALQDLHRFLTARHVTYQHEDPARVRHVLDELTVEQVLDPTFWRRSPPPLPGSGVLRAPRFRILLRVPGVLPRLDPARGAPPRRGRSWCQQPV